MPRARASHKSLITEPRTDIPEVEPRASPVSGWTPDRREGYARGESLARNIRGVRGYLLRRGDFMFKRKVLGVIAGVLAFAAGGSGIYASGNDEHTLIITMTNDPVANQIKLYDAASDALLQSLSTHGQGGAGGNARGIKQHDGRLVAVVNNGSNTVAIFRRQPSGLMFDQLVTTTSAPVSVDFGNDHMYVAGSTTVDSFVLRGNTVGWLDG